MSIKDFFVNRARVKDAGRLNLINNRLRNDYLDKDERNELIRKQGELRERQRIRSENNSKTNIKQNNIAINNVKQNGVGRNNIDNKFNNSKKTQK